MDKKLKQNPRKLDPHEVSNHTIYYKLLQHNKTQTYLITGQPS